jgi:hypothetical protein
MAKGTWHARGLARMHYVDNSGKVLGTVAFVYGDGLYSANTNSTRLGNYINESDAQRAVEIACDAPPPAPSTILGSQNA